MHDDRARAESFGDDAERYDRSRPTYAQDIVEAVMAGLNDRTPLGGGPSNGGGPAATDVGGGPPATDDGGDRDPPLVRVLDVGCGTGIAARLFAASGCVVLGVEPDARMAAVAAARGIAVEVAHFERWDRAGRRFDVLTAGQSWHWVDPVVGARRAAEALRPGGRIALFWNVGSPEPRVAEAFERVYARLAPRLDEQSVLLGRFDGDRFPAASDGIRRAGVFSVPQRWVFPWQKTYTTAEWLDQLPSHSDHHALAPDKLKVLLDALGEVIDGLGGIFVCPYETVVITARRC
jgi:SAM-dependent methyltransferase